MTPKLILMLLAFILLFLEALHVQTPRVSLGWFGLSLWALAIVLS